MLKLPNNFNKKISNYYINFIYMLKLPISLMINLSTSMKLTGSLLLQTEKKKKKKN